MRDSLDQVTPDLFGVSPGLNGEPCKVALPGKPGRGVSTPMPAADLWGHLEHPSGHWFQRCPGNWRTLWAVSDVIGARMERRA